MLGILLSAVAGALMSGIPLFILYRRAGLHKVASRLDLHDAEIIRLNARYDARDARIEQMMASNFRCMKQDIFEANEAQIQAIEDKLGPLLQAVEKLILQSNR